MALPSLKDIKNWSPEVEKQITEEWKNSEQFNISEKTNKKIYSIDTPPPYVNSPIHIAQAVTYCYMDFFARYKRMKGFDVLFPLGLDRNGLPIEMAAEKKFNVSPFEIGRDKFIEYCEKIINESSADTKESFAKLGISFTSYKEGNHIGAVYKTDSPEYRALTQATFIDLYKKGLIYEEDYLTNWDPKLRTTIADSEIKREERKTFLNYVKFNLKDSKEHITIATTRPELLCTATLIIYNPSDKRYQHLKNKKAIVPIFNIEIPIIEHKDADPNFGSGLVFMSKSAGDQNAVRFLREMGIKPVSAIGLDGKMNEHAKNFQGLKTKEAREKIIGEIKNQGILEKQEKITHSVPVSERSGAEIEFVAVPELYLKQLEFKKEIKKIANQIEFYPRESKKILDDWINSLSIDWPISRRRFYATPIPLWHSKDKTLTALPPKGKYFTPWKESPPKEALVFKNQKSTNKTVKDFPKIEWIGETKVFDTWMDSSVSELYIIKYPSEFSKKAFPVSLRPQGKEIVRTWLYYTLLRGYLETKKPVFEAAWIHQHLTDEKGEKMAKSKGNIVNPKEIIQQHGAEAIRIWSAIEGNLSKQDLKVSKERIQGELKTINKLLNIARFIHLFPKPKTKTTLTALDHLFIDYMEDLTQKTDSLYEKYDFYTSVTELRRFIWEIFASHYLEIIKARAYNHEKKFSNSEQQSAHYTLHYLLERLITILHPIIPQLTLVIAKESDIDLLNAEFPKAQKATSNLKLIDKIIEFNSLVWKAKKDKGMTLKDPIQNIKIPSELKPFEKDLLACHNIIK